MSRTFFWENPMFFIDNFWNICIGIGLACVATSIPFTLAYIEEIGGKIEDFYRYCKKVTPKHSRRLWNWLQNQ